MTDRQTKTNARVKRLLLFYWASKEEGGRTVRGMRGARLAGVGIGIWKLSALAGGAERANCPLWRGRSCRSSSIKLLGDAEMQTAFL